MSQNMQQTHGHQMPPDEETPQTEHRITPALLLWRLWVRIRDRPRLFQRTDPSQSASRKAADAQQPSGPRLAWMVMRLLPVWILLLLILVLAPSVLALIAARVVGFVESLAQPLIKPRIIEVVQAPPADPVQEALWEISPVFTQEVQFWDADIAAWSVTYEIPPNFIATIMQIESCGDPSVASNAGASGLFQVMPFHFEAGEEHIDPQDNARAGLSFMASLLELTDGDVESALAGYNAGPGAIDTPFSFLPAETQRYVYWGSGIYTDVVNGATESPRLIEWLDAGGYVLCERAASRLGLLVTPRAPTPEVQPVPQPGG